MKNYNYFKKYNLFFLLFLKNNKYIIFCKQDNLDIIRKKYINIFLDEKIIY